MNRRSIAKKVLLNLGALAIGIVIALVIAELCFRIAGVESYVQIVEAPRFINGCRVGADHLGEGSRHRLSTNPKLRYEPNNPPKVPLEKPPSELRILCLGDSITDNSWQLERVTYPKILEKLLNAQEDKTWEECRVVNSAVTGYNAAQYYEWYKKQWKKHQFDYLVLGYCCFNDRTEMRVIDKDGKRTYCALGREYVPYIFQFTGQEYLLRFSKLYRFLNIRLAPYFERRGREIHEFTRDFVSATRSAIIGLRKLCEDNGLRFIVLVFPVLEAERIEYNWIMDLLEQNGISHIDLKPYFEDIGFNEIKADFIHPNQLGHNITARFLANGILQDKVQLIAAKELFEPIPENLLASEEVTISVDSHNREDENAKSLVDNNPGTFWHVSLDKVDRPTWILIDFGEGKSKIVREVYAHPRVDKPTQFFRSAEILASKNGEDWEEITSISKYKLPRNNEWTKWVIGNNQPYRYYKVMIYNGHEGGNFYSISELALK